MTSKDFHDVSKVQNDNATTFGDVLHAICAELRLTQFQLATLVGYSEAAISRVVTGSRPLSQKLAEKLEEEVGGSADTWLLTYNQTKGEGSNLSISHFRDIILGNDSIEDLPGIQVRRMRRQDIINIFANSDGTMTFRGKIEPCEIFPFIEQAAEETSYDTHIGGYIDSRRDRKNSVVEVTDKMVFPAGKIIMTITRETITLPSWLEASLNPAWSFCEKGLFVAHGPIIDPGKWSGRLRVNVFNPNKHDISVSTDESFITLRFEMQNYNN